MCLPDLLQGKGEEWDAVGMSCTLFGIEVQMWKGGVKIKRRNSLQIIPLKKISKDVSKRFLYKYQY